MGYLPTRPIASAHAADIILLIMRHYLRAQVSRGAVKHNLKVLRGCLPAGCKLCAVVKADAYGHCLRLLLETIAAGADALAVATVPEALEVRRMGYKGVVLVLIACGAQAGGDQLAAAGEAIRHDVQLTVTDRAAVKPLQALARKLHKRPGVHVKIDTGMGRSGVLPDGAGDLARVVGDSWPLRLMGVYTHFATSDEADKTHAEHQFAVFIETLEGLGLPPGVIRHAANSAAIADMPYTALDMARPGIAIYGYLSGSEMLNPLPLRPALRLTAPLVQAKRVPAGTTCGYGRICTLTRDSRIGIVPAGYADGIARLISGRCPVGLAGSGGAVVPALGRISMDQIIIDLTDHPGFSVGREVELISPDPQAPHSVANLACLCHTIPYEVTCRLGRRLTYEAVDGFE